MGRRGPAPKPTNLRLLHGEHRPSRINGAEPQPRDVPPVRPGWLTSAAAEEWDRVVPDLAAMGTAKNCDATCLGAYCEAVARLRTASAIVAKAGLVLRDDSGAIHKNPAVAQARDASADVRLWAREFGLTPASRQPLRVEHRHEFAGDRLLAGGS
jgi:P27 family predicted phage terminase small subunit